MVPFAQRAKRLRKTEPRLRRQLCYRFGMAKSNRRIAPILAAALLISCRPTQDPEVQNDAAKAEPDRPVLPVVEPPLDREGLLMAVAHAASATALGQSNPDTQRELDGDRFELRVRFGCGGSSETAGAEPRRWTFDEAKRVVRFRVEPDFAGDLPMMESMVGAEFESVEGFWIRRPWLLASGCPAPRPNPSTEAETAGAPATSAPTPAAGERVGIAQFFTEADPRTHRRDSRAYEATKLLEENETPSAQGYDLVLAGRLKALPDGRVIACSVTRTEAPPECIISARFDRVRIERPDTGTVLAEWSGA